MSPAEAVGEMVRSEVVGDAVGEKVGSEAVSDAVGVEGVG